MADLNAITNSLIGGDAGTLTGLVQGAVNEGMAPKEILNDGLIKGMDIVGERMQNGDMFIPEVLMSAKAMSAAVEILKPLLGAEDASAAGKVVMGTAKGDLHDIGKNLVLMMLESAGFEVINLGVDVDPAKFVEAVKEHDATHRRHLGPFDHHHGRHERHHRRPDRSRLPRQGQGDHRRRPCDPEVRRRNRCRRLCRRCRLRQQTGQIPLTEIIWYGKDND